MQKDIEDKVYSELRKPFDLTCYSVDSSRGFDLTSLKAQYISIRLNEVLGIPNWFFTGEFEVIGGIENPKGVIFHGKLHVTIGDKTKVVEAVGGSTMKKNISDSYKSSQTDCLSKCASYIGIAEEAFCGLIDPKDVKAAQYSKLKVVSKPKVDKPKASSEGFKKSEKKVESKPIVEVDGGWS